MSPVVVSYVEADAGWAEWLAWELSRRRVPVSLDRADLRDWPCGSGDIVDRRDDCVLVPLLSAEYESKATESARWWEAELSGARNDFVAPIVVGPGSKRVAETLNLTSVGDGATAGTAVVRYLQLGDVSPRMWTTLFGYGVPAYPPEVPSRWRMWPAQTDSFVNDGIVDALLSTFSTVPNRLSALVSFSACAGSGKSASITKYAAMAASIYAGCWAIECSEARLLQVEINRLIGQVPGFSGSARPMFLAVSGAALIDCAVVLPEGVWHVVHFAEDPGHQSMLRIFSGSKQLDRVDLGDFSRRLPLPKVSDLSSTALMLASILDACDRRALPTWVLREGAAGAPDSLASRLAEPEDLGEILAELASAGLILLLPHSIRLRSAARGVVEPNIVDPSERQGRYLGFVANMVGLALSRSRMCGGMTDELLRALQHLEFVILRKPPRATYTDLQGYLDGWASGYLQVATVLSGLASAAFQLSSTSSALAQYVAELLARVDLLGGDAVSIQTRNNALAAESYALRMAGDPQAALNRLGVVVVTSDWAPAEVPPHLDDRSEFVPGAFLLERALAFAEMGEPVSGVNELELLDRYILAGGAKPPDDSSRLLCLRADLLSQCERFSEAVELLERHGAVGSERELDDVRAWDIYAFCLLGMSRFHDSVLWCEQALLVQASWPPLDRVVLRPAVTRIDALRLAGALDSALAAASEARQFVEGTGDAKYLVFVLRAEADVHLQRGAAAQSVEQLRVASVYARRAGMPVLANECQCQAARFLLNLGDFEEAARVLNSTSDLSLKADERQHNEVETVAADTSILRARIELARERPVVAVSEAEAATTQVDQLAAINERFDEAYYVHAEALLELGRFGDVVALVQQSQSIARALGRPDHLALPLRLVLGRALRKTGAYQEALNTLQGASAADDRSTPIISATILLEQGLALIEFGSPQSGRRVVRDSLRIVATERGPEPAEILAFRNHVVNAMLDLDEGPSVHSLAEMLPNEAGRVHGNPSHQLSLSLDRLSQVQVAVGDAKTAVELGKQAVSMSLRLGERPSTIAVRLYNLGHALIEAGQPAEAVVIMQEAVSRDVEAYGEVHEEVIHDLTLLSAAQRAAGKFAASRDSSQRIRRIRELLP